MAAEAHAIFCVGEPNLDFQDVAFLPSRACFSYTFSKIVDEVMTPGLPQVCNLWLGVSKGMFPVKHLAPEIPIAWQSIIVCTN